MKLFRRIKSKILNNDSFNICIFHKRTGHAEDLTLHDTFEQGFPETFDEFDWSLNIDLYSHRQYITTDVTDHFLFFTHHRCKFVYELPEGTLDFSTVTDYQIADIMYNTLVREERRQEHLVNNLSDQYPVVVMEEGETRWFYHTDEFPFYSSI